MLWNIRGNAGRDQFRQRAREGLLSEGYDKLFDQNENGVIPPNFADLWLLREAALSTKPSLILEYGSGYSTYVLAKTLKSIGRGKIISVEVGPEWAAITEARLTPDLRPFVEFVSPEPKIRMAMSPVPGNPDLWFKKKSKKPRRLGIATITFPDLHDLTPDFVFVDGPDGSQVPGYCDSATDENLPPIVSDLLLYVRKANPFICVDGRREQCAFLSANLPSDYKVKIHEAQMFTCFNPPRIS